MSMTRTFLFAIAVLIGTVRAGAQCTPDPLYADSVFGVWPDTTADFASGVETLFYSDTLVLLVPVDAGDIDPNYAGFIIDSVQFVGIDNLPPGLAIACNSQTNGPCTYLAGVLGCGLIEGTPTTAGTYDMVLNVLAYATVFGTPIPVPQSFAGYTIVIAPASTLGITEGTVGLGQVQNVPNPFNQRTTIEFTLIRAANTTVKVYNLLGEEVWREDVSGKPGMNRVGFEPTDLQDGIYLYKVQSGSSAFTGRMVLRR